MFFSLYRSQNIPDLEQSTTKILPQTKNIIPDIKTYTGPKKSKDEGDQVSWIRKKQHDFDDCNSLIPINISLSYNITKRRQSKFSSKNQLFSNRKSLQQNPQNKQKRFHSESIYLQQKRRKSQYSKFFNQTLVDCEHNFIGKNYIKQVINCKVNPYSIQTVSVSPLKNSLINKIQPFKKQPQFTPFFNVNTTKVFECRQKSDSLVYLNKKISLKEKTSTSTSKSMQDQSLKKEKIKNLITNKVLIKQIQDKVKNDIKTEMKTLKNLRLNKFQLKCEQNSQYQTTKKTIQILKSQTNLIQKQKRQSQMSSKKKLNLMTKYSDSQIRFREHFKNSPKTRKLQTSVQSYEDECYKVLNQHSFETIPEDLRPWDSENLDFFGFK